MILKTLSKEILETFESICQTVKNQISSSPLNQKSIGNIDSFSNITEHNSKVSETLGAVQLQNRESKGLLNEPAIVRLLVSDINDKEDRILYFTRHTPPTPPENSDFKLASYKSNLGRLASLNSGDIEEIRIPQGHFAKEPIKIKEYKILQKIVLNPKKNNEDWDSIDTIFDLENTNTQTIISLIDFLKSQDKQKDSHDIIGEILSKEKDGRNILQGVKRKIIENMGLRDRPVLDKLQDEIFRYPYDDKLFIFGPPGTGKTTTLVKRLGLKLDDNFLDEDEKNLFKLSPFPDFEFNSRSWIMFTPSELLKQYLKEAFNRENIPAPDENVQTWEDFSHNLARNDVFKILKRSSGGGHYVLSQNIKIVNKDTFDNQIEWYEDFYSWLIKDFISSLKNSSETLSKDNDKKISNLGKSFLGFFENEKNIKHIKQLLSLIQRLNNLSQNTKLIIDEKREIEDKIINKNINFILYNDKNWINELTKFYIEIENKNLEGQGISDDLNEDEIDEEEFDENFIQTSTRMEKAHNAYKRAVRYYARSIKLLEKKEFKLNNRNSKIIDWHIKYMSNIDNNDYKQWFPNNNELLEISNINKSLVNLNKFNNIIYKFLSKISLNYKKFRSIRLKENKWYNEISYKASEINSIEIDLLILVYLETYLSFIQNDNILNKIKPADKNGLNNIFKNQVFVDEVTDFSPIQIASMYRISNFKIKSFFSCGDFNQRLKTFGIKNIHNFKWAVPELESKELFTSYRQSAELNTLASEIIKLNGIEIKNKLPPSMLDESVKPVIGFGLKDNFLSAKWVASRIFEIDKSLSIIPSIAVLVNIEDQVQPFSDILANELREFNIRVNACIGGKIRGQENEVRVFDIKHIKGLEFEAVFFIDVQNLYETQPELFDKYLYVGTTRSANYLGITTSSEQLPKKFENLTKLFNENWK